MSKLETITIDTPSGSNTMQIGSTNTATINLGVSGDTINVPAGVTIANAGTATGFGGDNTPSFLAVNNATQTGFSLSTYTKVTLQNEIYDTDSAFADSRFTVPSGEAGKYLITFSGALQTSSDYDEARLMVYKNGAIVESIESRIRTAGNNLKGGSSQRYSGAGILNLSVGDYIELYGLIAGSGTPQFNTPTMSLSATKLIGV